MERLKQFKPMILILLVVVGIVFYWYELRPSNIRKNCKQEVINNGLTTISEIERVELGKNMNKINEMEREKSDYWYKDCLNAKGLEN